MASTIFTTSDLGESCYVPLGWDMKPSAFFKCIKYHFKISIASAKGMAEWIIAIEMKAFSFLLESL